MPDLLGVTNPVPGHDNANVNRNIPVSPNDTRIQNAPDLNRVGRMDNRTERQDSGDATGSSALRYDSNFQTFLQRLSSSPSLAQAMRQVIGYGTLVSSGMEEGVAGDMAALLRMLRMDESQFMKFFSDQMSSGSRFGGALFSILREAYGSTGSEVLRSSILQFLKRYSDYSSTSHIEGNLIRTLGRLTRSIPASWGNQLLSMLEQLEQSMANGDRAGSLRLLQGTILPFLGNYTSRTNDMGVSRTLISMLALDISRYENGSREGLLQAFHQLTAHGAIRERLGGFSDEALLRLVENSSFTKAAGRNQFADTLAQAAQRAVRGDGGADAQEAFRNILTAMLVNESVYMPLNHMIIPLDWNGKLMFSELWVDPDAEDNLKKGRGDRDNTIRFLFKVDIQGLGFFDMVLTCQRENVDLRLYGPPSITSFGAIVQEELGRIFTENGLKPVNVSVQAMDQPLAISSVFPKIFEGENSVNVKA